VIALVNKSDTRASCAAFLESVKTKVGKLFCCSSIEPEQRAAHVNTLKRLLLELCPDEFLNPPPLVQDLIPASGLVIMVVPIDLQAPKGRLILPQVQVIRDSLDADAAALVVKEREYAHILGKLKDPPDLVLCDSQVVLKMVADTPAHIPCTTFSILFSRFKGDLIESAKGAAVIEHLKPQDKILIAEACSHHAIEDDIGRVKIPRWLRQYVGSAIQVDVCSGRDYPEDLKEYALVVHCGGCMLNRREMLFRIQKAREEGVAITNYGICISLLQGVLARVLSPFPAALDAFNRASAKHVDQVV
jgi:[FeFe] hydrogenase H-cluster maturation GTPase HydF